MGSVTSWVMHACACVRCVARVRLQFKTSWVLQVGYHLDVGCWVVHNTTAFIAGASSRASVKLSPHCHVTVNFL